MDSRKRIILRAVVDSYIEKAEPVGSKTLATSGTLEVSPATLRNEMAALEEMGYLEHPHTSAGRVPTAAGYRLYVDELMERHRLSLNEMESINRTLRLKMQELDNMLMEAGRLVAQLTGYAAFTVTPAARRARILRLEAFLTDPSALVLVAAGEGGLVKTKWVRLSAPARYEDVERLKLALNETFVGQSEITEEQTARCRTLCGPRAAAYLPYALELIGELAGHAQEVFLSGETHLLEHPEFHDIMRARKTLEFLSEQRHMLTKLPEASSSAAQSIPGVQMLIGPENVARELREASVIMASYQLSGGLRGVIGVIGPTRMDYSKLESKLSYFASQLEKLLE